MPELYYNQPYLKEFVTEISQIEEKDGAFHIILEETIFYPGSDIIPCDLGFIEDCPIIKIYEEAGIIYHVSPKKPIKIHKAKCRLNWQQRFHYMQQYTASYLLSSCLYEHFNIEPLSFHLGEESSKLVLQLPLLPNQIAGLETQVNDMIGEGLSIETLTPTKQELKKLSLRKPLPKNAELPRLIHLEDNEFTLCHGIPLKSSLEVQLIKLLKGEKTKQGFALSFLAGQRGAQVLLHQDDHAHAQLQTLTKEVHQLSTELHKQKDLVNYYKAKELVEEATTIGSYGVVKCIFENMTLKELQSFGAKIVDFPKTIALLGLKTEDTCYLLFMCHKEIKKLSMNKLLKDSITLIDGNGGGSDHNAQGGGKSANNLASSLDYATMQLNKLLST